MGVLEEIKQDAAQTGALLGGILSFALLFWLYVQSIWYIILIALLVAAVFGIVQAYRSGYRIRL